MVVAGWQCRKCLGVVEAGDGRGPGPVAMALPAGLGFTRGVMSTLSVWGLAEVRSMGGGSPAMNTKIKSGLLFLISKFTDTGRSALDPL